MQPFEKMPFNDVCVEAIEKLSERAKLGRINFVAWSVAEGPLYGDNGFCGEQSAFYAGHYGLVHCAKRIMDRMDAGLAPIRSIDGPADAYNYDVSAEPISHDFIVWLATIKMIQASEGVIGPTKVCFTRNLQTDSFADGKYRAEFFKSVMAPALKLFDCVQDPAAKAGRRVDIYTYREIVDRVKRGEKAPRIHVPETLMADMATNLKGIKPVVITLREHIHWEHRNSEYDAWLKFAEYLTERGEHVIFVRDYAKADEDITGFETFPAASKDFLVRAALYENAKCNLFVSNGPATISLFGSRPFLQFIHCEESEAGTYPQNTPQWWWLNHGISKGQQFPWSAPDQRIVWAPDTYENIVEAWQANG